MCLASINITTLDEDGFEVETPLPTKKEVCWVCRGEGTTVNPSIDGDGLSHEDFAADPDFAESYLRGDYDVQCSGCGGLRVQTVVDEDRCTADQLKAYRAEQQEEADYQAACAAERRMGA